MLVWEFISRLEELLPVPDFTQVPRFFERLPGRVGISSTNSHISNMQGEGGKAKEGQTSATREM